MCDPWNDVELKKPPHFMLNVPIKDAPNVQRIQTTIYQYFRRHRPQETEFAEASALLGRLMARRKNSFRHMMGFRAIAKCNTATCRLLRLDIARELELFQGSLPDYTPTAASTLELPTRNSLDYVLMRLLNVHGVHQRIRDCCKQAAEFFAKMLRNYYFVDSSTLFLAVLAKLYNLSALLNRKCMELYNQLQPTRLQFPLAEKSVQHGFQLPEKIEAELDDQDLQIPKMVENTISMGYDVEALATISPKSLTAVHTMRKVKRLDLGVEVSRESIAPTMVIRVATTQNAAFDIGKELATVETTKRFIDAENESRKQSLKASITKDILPHEWIGATRLFQRKLLANDHKKALSIFKKFILNKIS